MFNISSMCDRPNIEDMHTRISDLMQDGVRVRRLDEKREEYVRLADYYSNKLIREYGVANPNSNPQLISMVREQAMDNPLIAEVCCDEKTGKWSTKGDLLDVLQEAGVEWAIYLSKYREANGIVKNIDTFINSADANGFVHPKVSLTKTNRISYSEPPLMSINKKLLWEMVAPRKEGNVLISADIKNQEPWILINMLDIEELKECMERAVKSGRGLYEELYIQIYETECQRDSKQYEQFKRGWNMLTYGGTKMGLKKYCKDIDSDKLYKYFTSIPEMKEYRQNAFKMARYNQQQLETYFGTEVYADKLGYGLQRTLMDLPIQGTGADILALLIAHFDEEVYNRGIEENIEILYSRHDEIIFEVDRDWYEHVGADVVKGLLRDILEHQVDDWEPFIVDIKVIGTEQ